MGETIRRDENKRRGRMNRRRTGELTRRTGETTRKLTAATRNQRGRIQNRVTRGGPMANRTRRIYEKERRRGGGRRGRSMRWKESEEDR